MEKRTSNHARMARAGTLMTMERDWRKQLWMDFDRDREPPAVFLQDTIDAEIKESFHRIDKLRIDNKMATEEYLQGLLEHIKFN